MLKKVIVVYDDTIEADKLVKNITGPKTFGSTIFKRKTLKRRMSEVLMSNNFIVDMIDYKEEDNLEQLTGALKDVPANCCVMHMFANYGIKNMEQFNLLLEKIQFINKTILVKQEDKTALVLFPSVEEYIKYLKEQQRMQSSITFDKIKDYDVIHSNALVDLGELNNFMQFITGGFDARFFNALEGDEYTVTKRSSNKKKIKSEYEFYGLLPDSMKMWFVMPFDYKEEEAYASYTMERYHMTDIAIRWIHNAINLEELDDILKRLFHFVINRDVKEVSMAEYEGVEKNLYITKVKERMIELKKSSYYVKFNHFIASGTKFDSIDEVVAKYEALYAKARTNSKFKPEFVVGHGDLCFSNILYNRETSMLKLIDPKGAIKEEELWTNPYYDIAKLSHSICGRYDFFNSGLFDIKIESDMKLNLVLEFNNGEYVELFKKYLEEHHFDYTVVRLYEASLFLSMLPLHMDNPQKVFGFLLNAINILEEVEKCIQD
jgi:thiamine kinase-like enzyme